MEHEVTKCYVYCSEGSWGGEGGGESRFWARGAQFWGGLQSSATFRVWSNVSFKICGVMYCGTFRLVGGDPSGSRRSPEIHPDGGGVLHESLRGLPR